VAARKTGRHLLVKPARWLFFDPSGSSRRPALGGEWKKNHWRGCGAHPLNQHPSSSSVCSAGLSEAARFVDFTGSKEVWAIAHASSGA